MLAVVAGVSLKYFAAERMIKSARVYERERERGKKRDKKIYIYIL